MDEIWKDIEGYEGFYQVSNLGRVKSLKRQISISGSKPRLVTEKILKPVNHNRGYLSVKLFLNKKRKSYYIHRLVAKAFLKNKDNKPEVNHINGDKTDNRNINLEWVSQKENMAHAFKNKMVPRGGERYSKKLDDIKVLTARTLHHSKLLNITEISNFYGVPFETMRYAIRNKNWKHLPVINED